MHVYLLLISLAKIVPIHKSIRTEISPEFYPPVILTIDTVIVNNYSIIHDF